MMRLLLESFVLFGAGTVYRYYVEGHATHGGWPLHARPVKSRSRIQLLHRECNRNTDRLKRWTMEAVDSMDRQTVKDRARGVGSRLSWQGRRGCDWSARGKLLAARHAMYVAAAPASKRPSLFKVVIDGSLPSTLIPGQEQEPGV